MQYANALLSCVSLLPVPAITPYCMLIRPVPMLLVLYAAILPAEWCPRCVG